MALSGSNPVGYTQENAHYLHHMPTKPDEPRVLLYSWGDYIEPDGPPTGHRMPFDQHRGASWSPGKHPQRILSKTKRGLPGFVNGARVSALPDTGCSRNTVSLAFAQDMKLAIRGSPADFKLGNSTYTKSLGTVTLDWAFLDSPQDISKIICDVLPKCNYPMILGSPFLTATQTLSKYKHRLTECLFSAVNVPKLNFRGCDDSRLHGYVGGYGEELIEVAALPDTGAERNIMDRK
ncbi:MAG: hypothetical protein L6R38_007874 [Xanthoria sp. 2 TBL-2021]|nr:MAG: hypothetical protein L6R38_007874 [Xanthoria sp. 2 TBL-2021]